MTDVEKKGKEPQIKCRRGGFLVALDYYDQKISASRRLLNLQCWAAQHNMEPFLIKETKLGVSLTTEVHVDRVPTSKEVKFCDIFYIQQWNSKRSIPLTSWNSFLETAPRDVILVQIKWKTRRSKLPVPCSTDNVVEKQSVRVFRSKRLSCMQKNLSGCT